MTPLRNPLAIDEHAQVTCRRLINALNPVLSPKQFKNQPKVDITNLRVDPKDDEVYLMDIHLSRPNGLPVLCSLIDDLFAEGQGDWGRKANPPGEKNWKPKLIDGKTSGCVRTVAVKHREPMDKWLSWAQSYIDLHQHDLKHAFNINDAIEAQRGPHSDPSLIRVDVHADFKEPPIITITTDNKAFAKRCAGNNLLEVKPRGKHGTWAEQNEVLHPDTRRATGDPFVIQAQGVDIEALGTEVDNMRPSCFSFVDASAEPPPSAVDRFARKPAAKPRDPILSVRDPQLAATKLDNPRSRS